MDDDSSTASVPQPEQARLDLEIALETGAGPEIAAKIERLVVAQIKYGPVITVKPKG